MKLLIFHTQIPFGYFLFALLLLVLALASGALIFISLKTRPRRLWPVAPSCVLLALVVMTAVANLNEEEVDLNPLIRESSELTGIWKNDTSSLELLPEGRYTCKGDACARLGAYGSWQRSGDFFISLDPVNSGPVIWRISSSAGHLRLAAGTVFADSDTWQSGILLEHTEFREH